MLYEIDVEYVEAAVTAALDTDVDSDIIDMAGYDGVIFMTLITDSAATGVATLKVEGDDANATAGMVALTGASATKTCVVDDDINGKYLVVDVKKPVYRYLRANVTSETANIAFGATHAIKYGAKEQPVSHTDITNGVEVAGPAQSA